MTIQHQTQEFHSIDTFQDNNPARFVAECKRVLAHLPADQQPTDISSWEADMVEAYWDIVERRKIKSTFTNQS